MLIMGRSKNRLLSATCAGSGLLRLLWLKVELLQMHLIKPATTAPLAFLSWWLVMSGVVGTIIEMLVIGSVPLGPWILPAVISAALFVLVLAFGAMLWLLRIGKSVPSTVSI